MPPSGVRAKNYNSRGALVVEFHMRIKTQICVNKSEKEKKLVCWLLEKQPVSKIQIWFFVHATER